MEYALTVLLPVYNAAKYLKQAIDSILEQSFSNFELLIIDDGSSDDSVTIVKNYTDPRIRLVVNESNLGISATLNKGIELSTTELIARMDADDISYPGRLQLQYEYFQRFPDTALLSTSVRVVAVDGKPIESYIVNRDYVNYNLNFLCAFYHPTVMYKRSMLLAIGGYTEKYSEDFDLWWRISRGYKLGHLEDVLLDYRLSETSLSNIDKKDEYDVDARKQLLRNIRFYMGDQYQLAFEELECLRHVFTPLLKGNEVHGIIRCIKKLDEINESIFNTYNLNYTKEMIVPYAKDKRDYTILYYYVRLPKHKGYYLLYKTKSLHLVLNKLANKLPFNKRLVNKRNFNNKK